MQILKSSIINFFPKIKFGEIGKYQNQDFDFARLILDNNEELCISPLKNGKSIKTIKNIISQLKIKKDDNRKGPSASATFYEKEHYKIGNNGNIWTINKGKWIKRIKKLVFQENVILNINISPSKYSIPRFYITIHYIIYSCIEIILT